MKDKYEIYEDPKASVSTRFGVDNKRVTIGKKLELDLNEEMAMVKAVLMSELLGKSKARTRHGGRWR